MKRKILSLALIAVLAVGVAFAAGRRGSENGTAGRQNCPQTAVCPNNNNGTAECPRLSNGNCPQECPRIKGGTACNGKACTVGRRACDQQQGQRAANCDRRRGGGQRGCRR